MLSSLKALRVRAGVGATLSESRVSVSKLFAKSERASLTVRLLIPAWKEFGVAGVVWSQSPIAVKGSPANPSPLVLSEPTFDRGVATVTVSGGSAGARYSLSTAPTNGQRTPQWVNSVRVQVAT